MQLFIEKGLRLEKNLRIFFLFFFIFILYQKTIGKIRRISDIIINVLKKEGDEIERTTRNECYSRNSE